MISRVFYFVALTCLLNSRLSDTQQYIHQEWREPHYQQPSIIQVVQADEVPCTCGVFLDSQVVSRGAALKPGEETRSIFSYAIGETIVEEIPGGLIGKKICTKKCIDEALKFIHTGPQIICTYLGKDITNEKVHLFIKNKDDQWQTTRINSGRPFTCREGKLIK